MKLFRNKARNREALALDHRADLGELLYAPVRANEMVGPACVVHIEGPLEQHVCSYGDSYEAIRKRFGEALASESACVVLRIDSPGGVVAGLNQAVYDMARAKRASSKPVYVYVDELACSAAYALACVGDEIAIPPSGVAGSIGVIAALVDTTAADKAMGLNFVTITSGARKADGHPHVAISEEAIEAEQKRVMQLAGQFFAIVGKSRGLSIAKVQGFEAGVFLGADAVKAGIADQVIGWEGLLAQIRLAHGEGSVPPSTAAQRGTRGTTNKDPSMLLQLKALIAQTKKALAAEKRASKRATLASALAKYEGTLQALKKTKYKLEEETTEEDDMPGDEPDKDDDESAEGDEEGESAEDAENGADAEGDDDGADAESEDDGADAEDEEPKKDAKKAKKAAKAISPGKLAAIRDQAKQAAQLKADVEQLKRERVKEQKLARIDTAQKRKHISPATAKMLRTKSASFVDDYLEMHNTPIVVTDDEVPAAAVKDSPLSAREQELQREALRAAGLDPDKIKIGKLANGGPPKASSVIQLSDLVKGA